MFVASGPVADFIAKHPTTKMLALAFLLLIGVSLVADGLGFHIPKGYIYSAMAFSVVVEAINILVRQRRGQRANPVRAAAAQTLPRHHEGAPVTSAPAAAVATPMPVRPRVKNTPATRAQSRPKSAPRKPAGPRT